MARVKLSLPEKFSFRTRIPVRITDLNYGGHLGNDALLAIIHEARVRFLQQLGYTEMNLEGGGLIMADVAVSFQQEAFYGEELIVGVTAADISRVGFDLYYLLEKNTAQGMVRVASAKTGMICYNYEQKKVNTLPEKAAAALNKG
ncbi:hypothetical protein GCM10027051_28380 [Niabella terrae]